MSYLAPHSPPQEGWLKAGVVNTKPFLTIKKPPYPTGTPPKRGTCLCRQAGTTVAKLIGILFVNSFLMQKPTKCNLIAF
jgi:hypothetical protein